jgi:hypothetical protein
MIVAFAIPEVSILTKAGRNSRLGVRRGRKSRPQAMGNPD